MTERRSFRRRAADEPDPFEAWVDAHPNTIMYIAVVVTIILLINVIPLLVEVLT
jgi:hypothetical protein